MARPTNITLCSFCGKSHAEVKKLIAGPGVYICDNCVVLCKNVLDKEFAAKKQKVRITVPKPLEIKRQLDKYIIGQAASMGAVLLCGGTKGKRYSLPNANIMIHQILGGAEGQATDVEIRVRYMLKLKQRLNGIISKHTGKSISQVEKDTDRDNFMTPDEAKAYGLVDEVVQSRKEIPNLAERATSLADKKE